MSIDCNNIITEAENLKLKFQKCKTLSALDMRKMSDLIIALKNCGSGSGSNQDLQGVLDTGSFAEFDGGNSFISLLTGTTDNREISYGCYNGGSGVTEKSTFMYVDSSGCFSSTLFSGTQSEIGVKSGIPLITKKRDSSLGGGETKFSIKSSEIGINTLIEVPAKINNGNYIINTTPETIYTVSTLPIGVLNDMAIVSNALSPTYLGALIGGGSVICPVWNNGTIWVSR
jgi:hypothetical protein